MTAKQKAKELVEKFNYYNNCLCGTGKGCARCEEGIEDMKVSALICVDEMIKEQEMWQNGSVDPVKYWQQVKQEIQKL
ncbi:hypothetical protein AAU57_12050 [Nonlabens sp. YIK11]|uniref:hypothetical protein n=1 Tax=Nonlabens sp. YIK11 TaxID=1453349 RepID=UPI0006DCD26A|nr:hypothetical protein [Nonlabens sp. YIK11]KQC33980.1 hypothetical protein AAU57_12050 [Nonlabens sp. YIK11]